MAIITKSSAGRRAAPFSTVLAVWTALAAIARTMMNRRQARKLAEMPDYLLKDIGLKRDDIHEALNRDWREDPTFRLAMTASQRRRRMDRQEK